MTSSFWQLFQTNLRGIYRNQSGLFWSVIMPVVIYVALSVLPIGSILGSKLRYSGYILPGILAMQIMQGGIYGLAYWMVDLKTRGVIKRFLVTPISTTELIVSVLLSRIVVMFLQAVILSAVGVIFFQAPFYWNVIPILAFILLGGGIFLLIGLNIASFADTYEAAAPITTAVGLPLTFLGNIFFPIDSLPHVLKVIGEILPITYLADGLRQLYLAPFSFHNIARDLLILAVWFVVILAFTLRRFRLEE